MKWFAVQRDRDDDWGNGSYEYDEAVKMLKAQGKGLIAVINEDGMGGTCETEITYEEVAE